jgi:hypothetical protein
MKGSLDLQEISKPISIPNKRAPKKKSGCEETRKRIIVGNHDKKEIETKDQRLT